jgi:hypothetical protein
MTYLREKPKVIYESKDGKMKKVFEAFLARGYDIACPGPDLPPGVKVSSVTNCLDNSDSQISSLDSFWAYPDYPMDSYVS